MRLSYSSSLNYNSRCPGKKALEDHESLPGGRQDASLAMRLGTAHVLRSSREALAHPLARQVEILAKCWSEWQDLNLRPPRPERGAPSYSLPRGGIPSADVRLNSKTSNNIIQKGLAFAREWSGTVTGPSLGSPRLD